MGVIKMRREQDFAEVLKGRLEQNLGPITFVTEDLEALKDASEGERLEIRFRNGRGEEFGTVCVDLYDDGVDLVVGLRGWRLDDDVLSV